MDKQHKKKQFIKQPEYPGGAKAFRQFIHENMRYPEAAIQNRVEGIVFLDLVVNDNGKVLDARVTKGIGSGCDEEALRLALLLKYGSVKNRGVRLKSTKKIRIAFKLPPSSKINYSIKKDQEKNKDKGEDNTSYGYTINF